MQLKNCFGGEMEIKDSSREILVNEISFVTKRMEKIDDPLKQIYYFSAIHGMIHRIMNIDYDPELVFAHHVLQSTHQLFLNRLHAFQKAGDNSIIIAEEQFKKLIDLSRDLGKQIKANKEIKDTLQSFVVLAYSTTGNGYYLFQKGLLKI